MPLYDPKNDAIAYDAVFPIWKLLWVLQEAHIKIVANAIYT